ncbi:MAG: YaeQ family protein [Steroidobacteraceae bacterium]
MALKSTVFKADLQISDMDRNYYQSHALTLAQHPSETEERVMVRLLVFALHADELLEFGKGLSSEEPDLWRKDLTGQIEQWIEIGQPDEQAIRRACGRAGEVFVYSYSGNSAQVWWDKLGSTLQRCKNLTVIDIGQASAKALATLAQRGLQVQCLIQDGQVQVLTDAEMVPVELTTRMSPIRK